MIERRSEAWEDGHYRGLDYMLVIVMVGLPARGKSYITEKPARYLNWLQHETRVFNVGKNRRTVPHEQVDLHCDAISPSRDRRSRPKSTTISLAQSVSQSSEKELRHPASFFDPNNNEALTQREEVALSTLDQLLDWLLRGTGCVGIFDATNSTIQRRQAVLDRIRYRGGPHLGVLFLESCCYDSNILEKNVLLNLSGPDYKGQDTRKALADFRQRIVEYEKAYIPLGDFEESRKIP